MNCPNCRSPLQVIHYEGIEVESCPACGGEWLDHNELGKVVRLRDVKFNAEERRAVAAATPIQGVMLETVDRDLICPKCGSTTDAINYGGDTGIIIDRCSGCRGVWLDGAELEKIQMVVEGWEDHLPEDLKVYGPRLHQVAVKLDEKDDVHVSRLPLVGRSINALINGILDWTT